MYRGLYIHIPFCIRKCRYCDFPSYTGMENLFDEYIDALIKEARQYKGEKIDTVFIGGGTPSILSCEQIKHLLQGIREVFEFSENLEFSCEANPGTLTEEKLEALKEGGVNRLSLGVQSFCDRELEIIGRIHDSRCAVEAVEGYVLRWLTARHQVENLIAVVYSLSAYGDHITHLYLS